MQTIQFTITPAIKLQPVKEGTGLGLQGAIGTQGQAIQGSAGTMQGAAGQSIQGTAGQAIQGATGQSIQGGAGSQGSQGNSIQGSTGDAIQGASGVSVQGSAGQSIQGGVGSQGWQGNSIQGSTGEAIQGASGVSVQGSAGQSIQGGAGSQGSQGNSIQGSTGDAIQGASGVSVQGTAGQSIQGGVGSQGSIGASIQGTAGTSVQGTAGESIQGAGGSQGSAGQSIQGSAGASVQGTAGASVQGSSGTQGSAGQSIQGSTGAQGADNSNQFAIDINRFGFLSRSETNLSFDGTDTITLADKGSGWSYLRSGIKCTISGNKTVKCATPMVDGTKYRIYIDSTDGALISGGSWNLNDTKVPVCTLYWDSSLTPKFILADERHTNKWDRSVHREHHFTEGTTPSSTGSLTGFTAASDTNSDKVCGISGISFFDEDLYFAPSDLTKPDGATPTYYILYRTGATSYKWVLSDMPFKYTGAAAPFGYIEYDLNGTSTASDANRFVNTYLFICNSVANNEADPEINTTGTRFLIVQGRGSYSSVDLAKAERFAISAGLPVDEGVGIWQITWSTTNRPDTVKGRCRYVSHQPISVNIRQSDVIITSGVQGVQGATGESIQGSVGSQGSVGASIQGTAGASIQGSVGSQGSDGSSIQGTAGTSVQGTAGESIQGSVGSQGSAGASVQGTAGESIQGSVGSQGSAGASIQGTAGASVQGTAGESIQGSVGSQGSAGASIQGTAGASVQGTTGESIQGSVGSQGSAGASIQGTAGASVQGSTGESIQGSAGASVQGVQGTVGSGTQGSAGIQGSSGSGTAGIWTAYTGAYASTSTWTFTGTAADAKIVELSLVTCTDSAGTTRRIGYVKSASESGGTVTVTVVTDSNLASGDKDFKVALNRKINDYRLFNTVPGEIIADASYSQGMFYFIKVASYLLPVDSYVRNAAAGSGAAAAWNVYADTTNLFSSAVDLATNASAVEQRPNTNTITAGQCLSVRYTSSAGATNKASDPQVVLFVVPQNIYTAF